MLVAIEGGDGAGKATAAAEVARQLVAAGRSAAVLSFPRYAATTGGWALGEYLAGRLPRDVPPRAAAVLYALDRLESRELLLAAVAAHEVVVLDRYIASNLVYQAAKVPADEAAALMAWTWALETDAFALPPPGLTVYLDTPVDRARGQIAMKRQRSYTDRTFDANEADEALQLRVRANYAALAAADYAGRWVTVTTMAEGAMRTPGDIAAEIVAAIETAILRSESRSPNEGRDPRRRWSGGTHASFAAHAIAQPKRNQERLIGTVDGNAPAHVIGFDRVMNAQEVRKNLNSHGRRNPKYADQPPITHRDFERIAVITATGRYTVLGDTGSRKVQRVEYRAEIDDALYVYTETIGIERKRVALLSLYRLR